MILVAPVKCRDCKHWIKPSSPYWARQVGPKCGGRIRSSRPVPALSVPVRVERVEVSEDQLPLFGFAADGAA